MLEAGVPPALVTGGAWWAADELDEPQAEATHQGRATERHTPELETTLYRVVQEALTNATKHGRAGCAVVELTEGDRDVHVTVRDDGEGFDPATKSDGFGLLGMRERAELLDGSVSIDSTPGRGTTVSATFPARRRETESPASRVTASLWPARIDAGL